MISRRCCVLLNSALVVTSVLGACTRMPVERNDVIYHSSAANTVSQLSGRLAQASLQVPHRYVDPVTGASSVLTVESEYFSANGRICRRYTERTENRLNSGLGCREKNGNWIEVPVDVIQQ